MKKKVILRISIIALILLTAVLSLFVFKNNNTNTTGTKDNSISFQIFLANYDSIAEAQKKRLEELELYSEPIITQDDILSYDWTSHDIRIKPDSPAWKKINELKVSTAGKPFVVVCNGERIYLGGFWNLISSLSSPNCHLIFGAYPGVMNMNGSLKIQYINIRGKNDTRQDKRIYTTLKDLALLK